MLSALLMLRRMLNALQVALREEEFLQILGAALALVAVGTVTYTLGEDEGGGKKRRGHPA
jgi:hypothetical protein